MNSKRVSPVDLRRQKTDAGFSLAEMAIVIFIFGLILVAGLKLLQGRADAAVDTVMESKMAIIRDAMIRYLSANKRLPCPDTTTGDGPGALSFSVAAPPDGIENRNTAGDVTTDCAGTFGVLPYQTLGLARDAAIDGWQNFFSYHISAADPTKWTISPAAGAVLPSGRVGAITLNDRGVAGAQFLVTDKAVVVVISHGKNGLGAFSTNGPRLAMPTAVDELENANGDLTYVRRDRTDDTGAVGGAIDDYVMFMTKDDLLGPLYKQGSIKSPEAKLSEDFQVITDAVMAQITRSTVTVSSCLNNNNALPTLVAMGVPIANQTDPWGTAYTVTAGVATINATTPASSTTVITITSNGPDKSAATPADNVATIISAGVVQGRLSQVFARFGGAC